ncbi:MAG: YdaU family protein [Sphingomonadales bacterium]
MSDRPWYKRYGSDFVHGSLGLTLEEKGAYSLCLDLIYDRGGPIPDDARWLAGVCGVSVRKWNSLRTSLIEHGKIYVKNGLISNFRADKEIEKAAKTARKLAENGAKGGRKRAENASRVNKNKDLNQAPLKHRAHKPEARSYIDKESDLTITREKPPDLDDLKICIEAYNAMAGEVGLVKVQKLTDGRRRKLRARLSDCGGVGGWRAALVRVRGSPFLTGQNNTGWKADFDFLITKSKFCKLMEGSYDSNRTPPDSGGRTAGKSRLAAWGEAAAGV